MKGATGSPPEVRIVRGNLSMPQAADLSRIGIRALLAGYPTVQETG
jgi:hypothetical protein